MKNNIKEMSTEELINRLYDLGVIEDRLLWAELDEYYKEIVEVKEELLSRLK